MKTDLSFELNDIIFVSQDQLKPDEFSNVWQSLQNNLGISPVPKQSNSQGAQLACKPDSGWQEKVTLLNRKGGHLADGVCADCQICFKLGKFNILFTTIYYLFLQKCLRELKIIKITISLYFCLIMKGCPLLPIPLHYVSCKHRKVNTEILKPMFWPGCCENSFELFYC